MEKFFELGSNIINTKAQLRKECIDYLKKVATQNGGYVEVCDPDDDDYTIAATINGGKSADKTEYVRALALNKENGELAICFETEQFVDTDRIDTWDLYNICDFVYQQLHLVEE